MSNSSTWKRITAGALALMIVAGTAPAGVNWTELVGGQSLLASAGTESQAQFETIDTSTGTTKTDQTYNGTNCSVTGYYLYEPGRNGVCLGKFSSIQRSITISASSGYKITKVEGTINWKNDNITIGDLTTTAGTLSSDNFNIGGTFTIDNIEGNVSEIVLSDNIAQGIIFNSLKVYYEEVPQAQFETINTSTGTDRTDETYNGTNCSVTGFYYVRYGGMNGVCLGSWVDGSGEKQRSITISASSGYKITKVEGTIGWKNDYLTIGNLQTTAGTLSSDNFKAGGTLTVDKIEGNVSEIVLSDNVTDGIMFNSFKVYYEEVPQAQFETIDTSTGTNNTDQTYNGTNCSVTGMYYTTGVCLGKYSNKQRSITISASSGYKITKVEGTISWKNSNLTIGDLTTTAGTLSSDNFNAGGTLTIDNIEGNVSEIVLSDNNVAGIKFNSFKVYYEEAAQEQTVTIDGLAVDEYVEGKPFDITKNGFRFTGNSADDDGLNYGEGEHGNDSVTITAPEGSVIKKLEFTTSWDDDNYVGGTEANPGNVSVSGQTVTITNINSNSVVISNSTAENWVEFNAVTITYVASAQETAQTVTYEKVEAKAATVNEAGNTEYYKGSDDNYYKLESDGKTYTEIAENSWVIAKIPVTPVDRVEPTVNTAGVMAHYKGDDNNLYTLAEKLIPSSSVAANSANSLAGKIISAGTEILADYSGTYNIIIDGTRVTTISIDEAGSGGVEPEPVELEPGDPEPGDPEPGKDNNATGYTLVKDLFLESVNNKNIYFKTVSGDGYYVQTTADKLAIDKLGVTPVDAKAATCETVGNIAYFIGEDNKYYTDDDENGVYEALTDLNKDGKVDIKDTVIEKLGHDWGDPIYTWRQDNGVWKCTAKRVCKRENCVQIETVVAKAAVTTPATCTTKGKTTYTATFDNEAFTKHTKTVTDIPELGHDWGDPTYSWTQTADGAWKCTATRVCKNNAKHIETAEATVSSEITKYPTCTEMGQTTYTATFTNAPFETTAQTQVKADIPVDENAHDWEVKPYVWSLENGVWKCTAERVCKHDASHKETETVTADSVITTPATCTAMGVTTYTATFKNKAFTEQTKTETDVPMIAHIAGAPVQENYAAPTYTTAGGYDLVTYCTKCGEVLSSEHIILDKLPLTHIEAAVATYDANGNIEYWYDENLGKYFADSEGKTEIGFDDTIIPMLARDFTASWKWASDYSSATLTLTEKTTGKKVYPKVTITNVREEPTCTKAGKITYTAKASYNNVDYSYPKEVVIPATGHTYGEPKWTWTANNSATATFTCECGDKQTVNAAVTTNVIAPTYTKNGKEIYTATVTFGGKTYTATQEVIVPKLAYTAPTVTYKKGDGAVKLTWTAVDDAEKYAVCGYVNGEWKLIGKTAETNFVVEDLTAGKEYRVAVIPMFGGEWFKDYSNAITVTPKAAAAPVYPTVTSIDYNEQYHQFRLTWDAVDGAEKYGVVVYLAGKWKVVTQDISANTTTFTSPKLKAGQTYRMAVCAKINGVWDTNKIESRAFEVTVK